VQFLMRWPWWRPSHQAANLPPRGRKRAGKGAGKGGAGKGVRTLFRPVKGPDTFSGPFSGPFAPRPLSAAGRVFDAEGKPLADAEVCLRD
jgi:hypothetical protein